MEEDALAMPTGASEQPVSAAQAWAQKKAAALAKAQALRAARAKDVLGGLDHGDFLKRLHEAEQRDSDRTAAAAKSGIATPNPKSKQLLPSSKPSSTIKKRPLPSSSSSAVSCTPLLGSSSSSSTPLASSSRTAASEGAVAAAASSAASAAALALQSKKQRKAAEQQARQKARKAAALQARESLQQQLRAKVAAQGKASRSSDPARSLPTLGYEVLGPIAAGAFSTILRCRSAATGELVAVKSFDTSKCAKDAAVGEARDRELAVLRLLREGSDCIACHPHIANLLCELGEPSSNSAHTHAVLEYCSGGSLKRYLQTLQTKMALPLVASATRQLAMALEHLHGLDVCHRDVKPANILLLQPAPTAASSVSSGNDGGLVVDETASSPLAPLHLKLCDFGFATPCAAAPSSSSAPADSATTGSASATLSSVLSSALAPAAATAKDDADAGAPIAQASSSGVASTQMRLRDFCGTPSYLAPEIASPADAHRGYHGKPVDMWALGCVIYEMLHSGRPAFHCEERFELEGLIRRCHHGPIDKRVPPEARSMLGGLLVASPAARLTASQVLERAWLAPALEL